MMTHLFLYIAQNGNIYLERLADGDPVTRGVKNVEQYIADLSLNERIAISSTIDFPEDNTNDPEVIALCKRLTARITAR